MSKLAMQSMLTFRKVNKPVRRANKPAKKANKPAKRANNNVRNEIQHVDITPVPAQTLDITPVPAQTLDITPVPAQTLDNFHHIKTSMIIKNPVIIHS
jgi:hypothetical protein